MKDRIITTAPAEAEKEYEGRLRPQRLSEYIGQDRVKKQMEKTQKEYYLNEQMRAIQKELGEKDDFRNEIQELEDKLKAKSMSEESKEKTEKEIRKLKMMSPMSAEATVVRNYVDWMLSLPWHEYSEDMMDIKEAERILDEDHYGLNRVKERTSRYAGCRLPRTISRANGIRTTKRTVILR